MITSSQNSSNKVRDTQNNINKVFVYEKRQNHSQNRLQQQQQQQLWLNMLPNVV